MISYYNAPDREGNALKVSIMLAETGLEYESYLIDQKTAQQNSPTLSNLNPNGKIPVIVDHRSDGDITVWETGAMLIYLAEKTGKYLPTEPGSARYEVIKWLQWQIANVGPIFGQWIHFQYAAPKKIPYAIDRFRSEMVRLYGILEHKLAETGYVAGGYSIADMAICSWISPTFDPEANSLGQPLDNHPNISRWLKTIGARPAVQAAIARPEGTAVRVFEFS